MLNPNFDKWKLDDRPELGRPVFILVEHDVIFKVDEEAPFVRMAMLEIRELEPKFYWRLLDYDPESEEEILQQCFSVIGWRYVSHEP